jgi:hypothetical protein
VPTLRRGTWGGKGWVVVAVLRLRGRGGFDALGLECRFLGSFGDVDDDLEDDIEVEDVRFECLVVECRMRLAKPSYLLKLAGKSVG